MSLTKNPPEVEKNPPDSLINGLKCKQSYCIIKTFFQLLLK